MTDWTRSSLVACLDGLRRGKLSSVELVQASWAVIDRTHAQVRALVAERREASLAEARAADARRADGQAVGPLCGIPMTIKDSFDTCDLPSTWGTLGRAGFVPERDATVVRRLRGAGAILLGKTNTPELTLAFQTSNRLFGATRNPYSLEHTPGGSSGGSAAMVAVGGSSFDIGSDTGGSVRLPAHFCGLAALRPTSGRVPRTGHAIGPFGMIEALTQPGPLARSVADVALLLSVLCGADGIDLAIPPLGFDRRSPSDVELAGLRVGFHVDNGIRAANSEVAGTVARVASALEALGVRLSECVPDGMGATSELFQRLMSHDDGVWVERLLEDCGTPLERSSLQPFARNVSTSARELCERFEEWDTYRARMQQVWDRVDALLVPVNAEVAAPLERPTHDFATYTYTMAYNLTGWPAAVVRAGTSAAGLPIGVQLVAPPWREDVCLALAARIERDFGGFVPPEL